AAESCGGSVGSGGPLQPYRPLKRTFLRPPANRLKIGIEESPSCHSGQPQPWCIACMYWLRGREPDNSPRHIAETRRYIQDFMRLSGEKATARELYDRMLALYAGRINPGSLWGSAKAVKPEERASV